MNADPRAELQFASAVCDQINERSDLDLAVWNEHVMKGPQRLGRLEAASMVKAALHDGRSDDEESDWEMLLASPTKHMKRHTARN